MSGPGSQRWVSCAEDEKEGWKCVLLARALRRTLTTRQLVIFVSDSKVSKEVREALQDEGCTIIFVKEAKGLSIRTLAKFKAQTLPGISKTVFLDCSVLPVKNCDELFHVPNGVEWASNDIGQEGDNKRIAFFTISKSLGKAQQQLVIETLVHGESPQKEGSKKYDGIIALKEINFGVQVDVKGEHLTPLDGEDVKLVYFVNGHPSDNKDVANNLKSRGPLEKEVVDLCRSLCPELFASKDEVSALASLLPCELHDSVAIVGMACRYPSANTIAEFWTLLEQGLEGIRKVPSDRWTKDNAFVRTDNMRNTEAGFLSCPVDTFDSKFFNISAADLAYLDPQQRMSLRVVWEGLEDAGIDPLSLKGTLTGVFGGWWRSDYKEMLQNNGIVDSDFLRGYMGNSLGPMTARISHFFDLIGPSFSTESGCSTSIAGVDMACDSLRKEACNLAIAVGVNLLLHPFSPAIMEAVLAPDGRCKTFDSNADGFGRAEGVGVLILKRLSSAVADGDKIWGILRGSAVVQEGLSKSMGTPTVEVESKAMQLALERSGVDPNDVEFVETHGTGTPVGDPIEVAAVARAYGKRTNPVPLTIGSVKTNIGHTESVCGIASIQKTVLSMKHELIPKHLHLKELNPEIDLDSIPARIPVEPLPWQKRRGGRPRIAGVNSFGITGAQAHILVQEPPDAVALPSHRFLPLRDRRGMKILTFSAKTDEAFRAQVEAYKALLKDGNVNLDNLEYSMHTGRAHLNHRGFLVGSTQQEINEHLDNIRGKQMPFVEPKICFLFPGQGSQYPGMARALYEENIVFQTNFDWCDSILMKEYGLTSLKTALWSDQADQLLKQSLYSQISIFVVEYCLLRLWESWGITPGAVLGHSLGEFAAAIAAGILKPRDAITLVVTRGKLINALPASGMLVVSADQSETEILLQRVFTNSKNWLDIAAVNSPGQTVLAGPTSVILEFRGHCENNGVKTHVLDSSHAFHSRLMDPMLEEYESVAKTIKYSEPRSGVSFISGVEGRMVYKADADYWVRHTRERVRFTDSSKAVVREGFSLFLEVGPHPILSPMVVSNVDELADVSCIPTLRKKSLDWNTVLSALGSLYLLGQPINWKNFHRFSAGVQMDVPGYSFEESLYWMPIKDEGAIPFHPLLGAFVPNPSDITIFRNNLNVNRLPFLKDHALGDKIIFPCAGYVDLCLTAGYAATQCGTSGYQKPGSGPLCITSFSIDTPVCLSEMSPTEFQVVVSKIPEGEGVSTEIYTKMYLEEGRFKWVRNASATFTSTPPLNAEHAKTLTLEDIKEKCTEDTGSAFDYDFLLEYGFNFGPSLRILKNSKRSKAVEGSGVQEFLFRFEGTETQENHERFILHPWTTDPMLQAQIFHGKALDQGENRKKLVVPVSIDTFVWWKERAPEGYIYVKESPDTGLEAHLFSPSGTLVASMIGTEFMETTLSNIMSLIDSQRNPYPTLCEIGWKEKLGPEEKRIPSEELGSVNLHQFYYDPKEPWNQFTPGEEEYYHNCLELAALYMLKAVQELGVEKHLNLTWTEVAEKIGVKPAVQKFFRYIMMELVKEGYYTFKNEKFAKGTKNVPSNLQNRLAEHLAAMKKKVVGLNELNVVDKVWGVLSKILTNQVDPLPLLYPEDGSPGPAEVFYTQSVSAHKRFAVNNIEADLISKLAHMGNGKGVIRILEVGAGVGSATGYMIKNMTEAGVSHFEYTYTDISPAFLQKGEQLFEGTGIAANFALLNLESDPLAQGFVPGHYDVIIAFMVIHATRNVEESVRNLTKLMRPGGYFFITELVEPMREINLHFGGLEGFWRFQDAELRPWNCELSVSKWEDLLGRYGFKDFIAFPTYAGKNALMLSKLGRENDSENAWEIVDANQDTVTCSWIIFSSENQVSQDLVRRLEVIGASCTLLQRQDFDKEVTEQEVHTQLQKWVEDSSEIQAKGIIYAWPLDHGKSTREVCEPLLHICKFLNSSKAQGSIRFVGVTQGQMWTGPSDYAPSGDISSSPAVSMVAVLANENPDISCKCIDLDSTSGAGEVFAELFGPDPDVLIAYRNKGQRFLPRLKPLKIKNAPLPIPRSPRYKLLLPSSHLIQDIKFIPCEPEPIPEGRVEIEVKAYSLNFLDVFIVTKPDPVFDKINYLGVDIAGVITAVGPGVVGRKVGDRVVVVRRRGEPMPSHLVVSYKRTLSIPEGMTFAEASTYPMGILTVASCLIRAAKGKPGDIVLVHTASGGVGLFAIEIARQLGCEVVCTAGNERKRNYLRHVMGVKHVFNSRNTEYEHDIRKALGGRGVDIVLNSLTGPGFKEATLAACDKGARFIEMSKINIWTKADIKVLRSDVYYEVVDVATVPEDVVIDLTTFLETQLMAHIKERPPPLPFTRFDASELREALEYMEKVKHIGKIVIMMPEPDKVAGGGGLGGERKFHMFNEESTYLITGGCGGIGLEVAKWMRGEGAKTFLLLGRSANPKGEALEKIEKLRSLGAVVEVRSCNVGDMNHLEQLLEEFESGRLPPLRGVMHAAGLLDDATYENQTWSKFENAFHPKVNGAWNLHQLSLRLRQPLEHFVLFSSTTAVLGSPGQSNYSAANYYMDHLIHHRHSIGLSGTTINWGQWGEVGMAAHLVVQMHKPFPIHQGIAALELVVKSHRPQTIVTEADFAAMKSVMDGLKGLLSDFEMEGSQGNTGLMEIDGDQFWRDYDAASTRDERYEVVRRFLKRLLRLTLKMDKNEEIEDHVNFQDIGMDSLMMVEMKNGLQASVGKRVKISINAVKDCKTVAKLSDRLVELISGKEELPPPTEEELKALVYKDSKLPEEIQVSNKLLQTLPSLSKVRCVLVLGATGMLGPYVVKELLAQKPSLTKIYCLMKPSPVVTPEQRFTKVYDKKGLLQGLDMNKIQFVVGDVKETRFGIRDSSIYTQIAEEVDLIVNLAVKVSFDEIYRETEDPNSSRVINVFGMRNVLSFAVEQKLKYVLHTSTFAAASQIDNTNDGFLLEDWPSEEEALLFPQSAYSISKLICDCQAREAVRRGVPCKVFRLPQIGGDSKTGGNVQMDSFLMTRCLAYLYTGYMHGSSIPLSLMAVDQCANLCVKLFFMEGAGYEMFHVLNPHMGDEREFEKLAGEFGVSVQVMEDNEFIEKWKKEESSDEMVQLVKFAMTKDNELLGLKNKAFPYYTSWNNGNKRIFWSRKLEKLMPSVYPGSITPSWDVLRNDLVYARDSGVFARYRIKYKVDN